MKLTSVFILFQVTDNLGTVSFLSTGAVRAEDLEDRPLSTGVFEPVLALVLAFYIILPCLKYRLIVCITFISIAIFRTTASCVAV